jgi:hypothetical protein
MGKAVPVASFKFQAWEIMMFNLLGDGDYFDQAKGPPRGYSDYRRRQFITGRTGGQAPAI